MFAVNMELPIREHPSAEVWNVSVGRRYRFAGFVEVSCRLRLVPDFTGRGILN